MKIRIIVGDVFLVGLLLLSGCAHTVSLKGVTVRETFSNIVATAKAPFPREIENETQSRAVSREAAVAMAHRGLLEHVLAKKANSRQIMAEAEIPYIEIQKDIRALVSAAPVRKSQWVEDGCRVTVSMDKTKLKQILRKL